MAQLIHIPRNKTILDENDTQDVNQFITNFTKEYQDVASSFIPNLDKSYIENLIDQLTQKVEFIEKRRSNSFSISGGPRTEKHNFCASKLIEIRNIAKEHNIEQEFSEHITKLQIMQVHKVLLKHNMNYYQYIDKLEYLNKLHSKLNFLDEKFTNHCIPLIALLPTESYDTIHDYFHLLKLLNDTYKDYGQILNVVARLKNKNQNSDDNESHSLFIEFATQVANFDNYKKLETYMNAFSSIFSEKFLEDYINMHDEEIKKS